MVRPFRTSTGAAPLSSGRPKERCRSSCVAERRDALARNPTGSGTPPTGARQTGWEGCRTVVRFGSAAVVAVAAGAAAVVGEEDDLAALEGDARPEGGQKGQERAREVAAQPGLALPQEGEAVSQARAQRQGEGDTAVRARDPQRQAPRPGRAAQGDGDRRVAGKDVVAHERPL